MNFRANEALGAITVAGTPQQIGTTLGKRFQASIRANCEACIHEPPPLKETEVAHRLDLAAQALRRDFPEVYLEMVATAAGAGVPFPLYLTSMYEELWDKAAEPKRAWTITRGCSDIVAKGKATASGKLLVGHNNDVDSNCSNPVIIQYAPKTGVAFLGVSIDGFSISTSLNAEGVVFTGNEVTAKDGKGGIPRLVLMRIASQAPTIEKASELFRHPDRASSYNNIVSDSAGRVVNLEGSATRTAVVPFSQDTFAHTNHYLKLQSQAYGKSGIDSVYRLETAKKMLADGYGSHTVDTFRSILAQHRAVRGGICKHNEDGVSTRFSVVVQPQEGLLHYCASNPCNNGFATMRYMDC